MHSNDATLTDAARSLADIVRELQSIRIRLDGYEGSVAAVTLRPELSRLQRQLELKCSEADGGVLYELKVAPDDVGKVIGRDGRTVNALRTVMAAAAQKTGAKVRLEILDDRRNGPAPGAVAPVPEVGA